MRGLLVLMGMLCLAASARAGTLLVSAASSLTNALRDVAPLFEQAQPGTTVQFNFGASGALLAQVTKGAPVDVLITADQETMAQAQQQGLLKTGPRRNIVSNALVVITPTTSTRPPPKSLSDLAGGGYRRIAIGQPGSVPVGRYARGVLESAGLWSAVEGKMIAATNVRQALDYVARGEVDAGFVYATDAALMPDKVKVALVVPTATPITYPAAALAGAPNPKAAAAWVEFLVSPAAQAVFAKHGFGMP